jgi:hypothetical protein
VEQGPWRQPVSAGVAAGAVERVLQGRVLPQSQVLSLRVSL